MSAFHSFSFSRCLRTSCHNARRTRLFWRAASGMSRRIRCVSTARLRKSDPLTGLARNQAWKSLAWAPLSKVTEKACDTL
eukprot:7747030-Pyramimonas_sp.AAC.1